MTASNEWWQEFFRGPWGEVQARGYPQEQTRREVDFLVRALGLPQGARVLDIPCGTGRHSLELAGRGFRVTGLDFNRSALEIARAAASQQRLTPVWVESDMREIDWQEEFDAAFNFFSSFGYFESEADDVEVARRIARALRPGGRLLIDTHVTETLFARFKERDWSWTDDARTTRMLEERHWDLERGRMDGEWTFIRDGEAHAVRSSLRLYSYRELCELLRTAGFGTCHGMVTGSGDPFVLGAARLALVAEKPGGPAGQHGCSANED